MTVDGDEREDESEDEAGITVSLLVEVPVPPGASRHHRFHCKDPPSQLMIICVLTLHSGDGNAKPSIRVTIITPVV